MNSVVTGSRTAAERLPRWSFRTRLAMIIALSFVAAGICLLTVQYLLVSQLFDQALATSATKVVQGVACTAPAPVSAIGAAQGIATSCTLTDPAGFTTVTIDGSTPAGSTDAQFPAGGPAVAAPVDAAGVAGTVGVWFEAQSSELVDDVLTRLLVFSGVVLLVFAVAAAGVAWWLARRSLKRIGEVTAMAQEVSTTDLHRRLELPGPRDEIKELADTIDAMLDRLESAFAAQDRFVANASHELRTPLTTSRTALEIPLAQGRVPIDLQPAVRTALKAGAHSDRLITSLLTLARGQGVASCDELDLAVVAGEICGSMAERVANAGLAMEQDLRPSKVLGDPTMITQAVTNLLDNAIRHNVDGGRIWVSVRDDGGTVRLLVENTGPVIDPDTVALLCEPFYRAGASRLAASRDGSGTGVGLGLSIVSSINQAHNGDLEITSREGGGLVVGWQLPGPGTIPCG
jgi:signal transduction histidine kinase